MKKKIIILLSVVIILLMGIVVWFNIPLYFEKAVFNFKGKTVTSDADGLLGGEKVNHILIITHLGTSEKEVYGELNTTPVSYTHLRAHET